MPAVSNRGAKGTQGHAEEPADSRRFAPLFWCQLCSALNDNFLKNALAMLILFGFGGSGATGGDYAPLLITASGVVLIAPFFFLSGLGGELADKYDKAPRGAIDPARGDPDRVTGGRRLLPAFGAVAVSGSWPLRHGGRTLRPVKYGLLPEKLSTAELPAGNALVEGATFLAILVGTIAGGISISEAQSAEIVVGVIVVLAFISWSFARAIPSSGPAAPQIPITRNPIASTFALLGELRADWRLWSGGHIVSWFWLVGFVALSLLPTTVKLIIGGSESVVTLCLAVFTIGIASGSLLAARASRGRPNLALVPIAALLMACFRWPIAVLTSLVTPPAQPLRAFDLLASPTGLGLVACFCGLAVAGGLFVVPTFAAVQAWAPAERRARVIAGVNVLNAAYMLGGGAVVAGLQAAGIGSPMLFAITGVLNCWSSCSFAAPGAPRSCAKPGASPRAVRWRMTRQAVGFQP